MKRISIYLLFVLILTSKEGFGQSEIFSNNLFNNRLFINPAFAGSSDNWKGDFLLRTPMNNSQKGLATSFLLTLDGPIKENAAIGFNVSSTKAGLLTNTIASFNYGYAINFKEDVALRLGISAGFNSYRVDNGEGGIIGEVADPLIANYNNVPPSFLAGFGASFKLRNINLYASLPNVNGLFQKENAVVNESIQLAGGAEYVFENLVFLPNGSTLQASILALQYRSQGTVVQGGLQVSFANLISANGMYSTNGVISAGAGIPLNKISFYINYSIGGIYSKNIYGGSGVTELMIRYNFKK